MMCGLSDQSGPRNVEKGETSEKITNLSASISTPETLVHTKAKCPLMFGCTAAPVCGYNSNKCRFRHREATLNSPLLRWTVTSHWQTIASSDSIKIVPFSNYLYSVWWIIECNQHVPVAPTSRVSSTQLSKENHIIHIIILTEPTLPAEPALITAMYVLKKWG